MYEKLKDIFNAVAIKNLSAVDIPKSSLTANSNQHEIGGLVKAGFGHLLGKPEKGKTATFQATMVYLGLDDDDFLICEDTVSWYDTRSRSTNRGPEYRLYYRDNEVTERLERNDFFLIALTKSNTLIMVFTKANSEQERQLRVLFGAKDIDSSNSLRKVDFSTNDLLLPIQTLLSQLGIELHSDRVGDDERLNSIVNRFGGSFPNTKAFSEFARQISQEPVDAVEDPDGALITWLDEEEHSFRLLERHIVERRLSEGFGEHGNDVDEFIKFSLSVQNRRKSRAGHSFENHIEVILELNKLKFSRGGKTEGKRTPDFLFPSTREYQEPTFPKEKLRMLGAKTSCKDRWRQVLAEANRIERKHLITIQPAISEDQTTEMQENNLQLIVPNIIQETYTQEQQKYLLSFAEFIEEVKSL